MMMMMMMMMMLVMVKYNSNGIEYLMMDNRGCNIDGTGLDPLLSFLSVRDGTCPLHAPVPRPASYAGPMHNLRGGTSVV